MKKITIKDIAVALNKSQSTVSKALADREDVSAETKKLIKDYAAKNNFQTNKFGRSLRTGKSKIIGVLVSEITDMFVGAFLSGIEEELSETDYSFIPMQSMGNQDLERRCIDKLYDRGIDGLIISPLNSSISLIRLREIGNLGLPIIVLDLKAHLGSQITFEPNDPGMTYSAAKGEGRVIARQMLANLIDKICASTTIASIKAQKKDLHTKDRVSTLKLTN